MTTSDAAAIGVALSVLLLLGLHRRLASMPAEVWGIARRELGRARERDEDDAQRALAEAVEKRAGVLLNGLRRVHDDTAAQFRRQVSDAEMRARVAERHAVDTAVALETAMVLVRALRSTLEGLTPGAGGGPPPGPKGASLPDPAGDDDERPSMLPAPAGVEPPPIPENDVEGTRETLEMKARSGAAAARETTAPPSGNDDDAWDDPNEQTKVFATTAPARRPSGDRPRATRLLGPLRVPERRPPPIPKTLAPPAGEEEGETKEPA